MADINLTGQEAAKNQIQPRITVLRGLLEQRKEVWGKLEMTDRVRWIKSGRDPIMTLAWTIFRYLYNNFFGGRFVKEREVQNGD